MTIKLTHHVGQYRAELFDDFVARLLTAMHPQATLSRKIALRLPHDGAFRSVSIDFRLTSRSGDIVIETKAPYTEPADQALEKALERFRTIVALLSSGRIQAFILALPAALPQKLLEAFKQIQNSTSPPSAMVVLWDEYELKKLAKKYLGADIKTFSVEELENVLRIESPAPLVSAPKAGVNENVVALVADFCSFTKFVEASGGYTDLLESMMGRFYRETRQAIRQEQGFLDKYMGDGVLAYWFGHDAGRSLERCVQRLVGIAVNLADEWQDQIDSAVEIKGLRAGAAIGTILFVSEERPPGLPLHAIGNPVNVAHRLQGEAEPNSLVVSNRLRLRFFEGRPDFERIDHLSLKGINPVVAWRKSFGKVVGGSD